MPEHTSELLKIWVRRGSSKTARAKGDGGG
ncbi:hypothetical protein MTR67_042523 [Solanum verrucosum]|uniref:Uncharacterized protein n=1 Tax=Solanum verrucosum TaxID=315347 RepID=A0AAF0UPI6_SOLVR|nr:hypothetical protein MTR67_042523 [Solanum verrucosum]